MGNSENIQIYPLTGNTTLGKFSCLLQQAAGLDCFILITRNITGWQCGQGQNGMKRLRNKPDEIDDGESSCCEVQKIDLLIMYFHRKTKKNYRRKIKINSRCLPITNI